MAHDHHGAFMKHQLLALTVAMAVGCGTNPEPSAPNPPLLDLTPGAHDFLDASVGTLSARMTFTVRNTGGTPTGLLGITWTGPDANQFMIRGNVCASPGNLRAGQSCTFDAYFVPSGSPGTRNATLNVGASATASTAVAAVTGTILPVSATVGMSPATHDFGYGGVYYFIVTNTGGAASGTLITHFSGPNAEDFSILANSCPTSLDAGASCVITVQFGGSDVASRVSAWLNVTHPGGAATPAHLTGTGV
jgi:hypothetical protein